MELQAIETPGGRGPGIPAGSAGSHGRVRRESWQARPGRSQQAQLGITAGFAGSHGSGMLGWLVGWLVKFYTLATSKAISFRTGTDL